MYLYDTRKGKNEKERFPKDGWFFPCISCRIITGSIITYPYKKRFIFFNQYVEVPCCKKCKIDEQFDFDKKKYIR